MYEQYFGENVDLFNDDTNRQKDPYAVTVGVNYTPFTLVTAGISQKMGKGDTQDTQFNLSFSYSPSVGLDKQLDPGQVALRRSLQGSRQDLVNRNNTIVLDYRKQDLISLGLPEKMEGAEGVTLPVSATINSKYGVDRIDWQADSLTQHGGKITRDARSGQYSMTLPDYQYGGASNHYVVTGKAYDAKGNDSNNSQMNVYVNGFDASTWQTTTTAGRATLPADGISTSTIAVNLVASDQQPVTGMAGQLAATVKLTPAGMQKGVLSAAPVQNATVSGFTEASPGVYTGTFTSGNVAGAADIVPVINGTTTLSGTRIMLQGLNVAPALSTLTASKTNALANGTDTVQLTAKVTTPDGAPYQGVTVFWDADNAAAQLSGAQSISDENGVATITVSSLSVINTAVSARIEQGGTLKSEALSFGADTSSAQVISLSADKLQALASNTDNVTLVATVRNAQNQPLTGAKVDWTVEQGTATLNAQQSTTDEQGNAQITLASSVAGDVVVSARAGTTEAKNSDAISFVADSASMNITTLTLDKTQALANGSDAVTYTATVTDANGNKVQGAPVNWSSDKATAQLSASLVSTDAQGQATIRVITTTASDVVISAQLPAGTAKAADAATFIADASTAKLSTVTADKTQALANGTDVITLSTTVTDASGNPLSNADVSWSATPTAGTPSSDSTKTDAQGLTTIRLTSSSVTDYSVTASVNGTQATSPTQTFSADAFTAHLTSLVADKTAAVVAGKDRVNLSATVLDANNHPVQGVTVSWSSDNSSGTFTPVSGVTGVDGIAVAQFIGTKAQTTVITATMGSGSKTQSLEMIADNSTARFGTVTASKTQALANGTDVVIWTATVEDANQNPINNMAVNWSSDNVSVTPANGSTSTNASGVATVTATSTQTADAVMTAALTTPALSSSASKVSFIADASTAKLSAVTADKTQALANGTDVITLSTTVTDASGNPLSNADVSWSATPTAGTPSSDSTKTDAQGLTTIRLTSSSVTASVNGTQATSPTLTFSADAFTAHLTSLVADKTAAVVAGKDRVNLSATVLDANNHPVQGVTVSWSSDNSSGTFTPVSGVTGVDGIAVAQFIGTKAQTTVITATMGSGSKTQSLEMIADNSTARFGTVTASKTQALANGTDVVIWTATVEDANQNPINNMAVNWSSDNVSVTPANSSTSTNASGVATVTATSTQTADAVMTAALTTPALSSSASKVSFIADVSTAQLSTVTTDKTQALANGTEAATLATTVTDAQGNPLEDVDVNWSVSPVTGTLSSTSTKTTAQGMTTVTLSSLTVGNDTVTASVNGKTASSPAIAFIADAATAKIATLTADKTTAVVAGVDTVALQATVLDANNHPVANIPVTWSSDNAAGILAAVSGVTDINGVASATLSSTLAQNTVVTASAGSSQKTLPVEIIADAASAQVTMAADKTQAVANGTEAVTWTATVKDTNSNPVKAVSVDWSGDNASVTLAGSTSQTTAAGTATVTGTSLKTGSEIVTATLTQQQRAASAAAVSYIADVSTADIASLTVDRPTASANGSDKAAFTATVKDAQGNLVTNAAVNWATTLNTLADITSQTNASGVATMTLSGTASGDATVTASVGGKSKSAMTKFVSQINSDWNITGASGKFSTNFITGYGYMGFVAVAPTGGPTSLVYVENGVTPLTTPMTDEQGQQVTVNFGGQRTTYCSTHTFNTYAGCSGGGDVRADLLYSASDNPGLPAGVYHGTIHFAGQDRDASGVNSFNYEVSVSLTVP